MLYITRIALTLSLLSSALYAASSADIAMQQVKDEKIEFIDFLFTDMLGTLRSITIPASQFASALTNGLSFDGSSIPGCTTINESDMLLWADLKTFSIVNHMQGQQKTGRIMCDIYRATNIPYEADPRTLLKQVLAEAHELGYEFYVGPELEFFLFDAQRYEGLKPCDTAKYFQAEECSERDAQKKSLLHTLLAQGIGIEKLHHEVAPGQHEVSIRYGNALEIADQIMLCKHAIKSFARRCGQHASFMPKPIYGQNGSGMHVHFSLYDMQQKKNAFSDTQSADLLSETAHHFIAGVLQFSPELCALFNPSINSYKRLVPGHEAPIYRCWATKNRSSMIRIPQIDPTQTYAARAEIRSPDALANPYLVFAGLLKAGLEGIKSQLEAPQAAEMNVYRARSEELAARNIGTLPTSLEQALELFEQSDFMYQLLGQHAIHEYLKAKREELISFKKTITNWEIERYL